jgi:hypothetical protein
LEVKIMMKRKDRKLYDIKLELYSSGKVDGEVRGKGNENVHNFIVLFDGNFESEFWIVSDGGTYVLAELLVDFLYAEPDIFLTMTEIMLDEQNEEEIVWN